MLPRWLIVKRYQVEANPASELELVSRNTFDPQRAVVLEERPIWDPRIRPSITEGPEDIKIKKMRVIIVSSCLLMLQLLPFYILLTPTSPAGTPM